MNDSVKFVARYAVAPGLATLAVATFRPSQPFLAILVAFLLLAKPLVTAEIIPFLVAAWSGIAGGIVLISLFPQQPWFLFPAFAATIIFAIRVATRTGNTSTGLLVAIGLCAALPAGLIHPTQVLHAGWDHGWNLTIGIFSAWIAFAIFPAAPAPTTAIETRMFSTQVPFLIACTVVVASWIAVVIAPASAVVLVIAALTSIWAVCQPALLPKLGHKAAGALLGAALSVIFDVIVAGSGNSLTLFLGTLMAIMAGLAWCTLRWKPQTACFTQCCAMFTVAAPMIPLPDTSLAAMGARIVAILVGFGSAATMYGLIRLAPPVHRDNSPKAAPDLPLGP